MTTPKVYELTTIADIFDKVPSDRIPECCAELGKIMSEAKGYMEMLAKVAALLAEKDGKTIPHVCFSDSLKFPIKWVDDGKGDLEARFKLPNGETLGTLKISKEAS